jgi:hypothetical protein
MIGNGWYCHPPNPIIHLVLQLIQDYNQSRCSLLLKRRLESIPARAGYFQDCTSSTPEAILEKLSTRFVTGEG